MSESTGDMTSAVEAAFAASSTPEPASTTSVETTAPSTTATATSDVSQAAISETPTTPEPGPIPYTRFKEVNERAGKYEKELEALGWAKGLDPQITRAFADLQARAKVNPLVFTEELEAVRDHPVLGPQLRSWAARTLGFRNQPRPEIPAEDAMPEPDLHFEDGRKSYSDQQLQKRDQWLLKQWESKIDEKVAPLANKSAATEKYVADQVYAGIEAKAQASAKTELDTLRQQYPQFAEHEADIKSAMLADASLTLKQAWAQVFIDKVGPQLASQSAATVQKKVSAGSANPSRPSGAASPKPAEGFREALEQAFGVATNA
jgi:hypothetical protein